MIEILEFIDKPLPVLEEVNVYPIKYAKAADIKTALEEFVAASREEDESSKRTTAAPRPSNSLSGGMRPGVSRALPGVTRPQTTQPEPDSSVGDALVSDADRGMIRGKVQIMADERSNQLIIVTRPSNMAFFERIIKVLDIETAPEIAVEVIRLKYAQAETEDSDKGVADLLNELIDSTSSSKDDDNNTRNTANQAGNQNLTRRARQVEATLPASTKSRMGELKKENIKILADSRINAVMVMASPSDLAAIKEIIAAMDVPVAQVLIETVVLEVTLNDEFETGVQWVKRISGGSQYRDSYRGGGMPGESGDNATDLFSAAAGTVVGSSPATQYFGTINKLNLDFLLHALDTDGRTKMLTSPILMTQDNKEATIESTRMVYLYNGMKYMGYSGGYSSGYQPDITQEEIGLSIKVTPRINPDGTVVLSFEETFQNADQEQRVPGTGSTSTVVQDDEDEEGGSSTIGSSNASRSSETWPTPTTRKISGSIAVNNGQTVVIGGLVSQTKKEEQGGIPILRNIPWIGKYLFGYTEYSDERTELLVFLTPYVFQTSEEAQEEAKRRKDYLDAAGIWNRGWSSSELADVPDEEEMLRREKQKRAYEDKQFAASQERVKARREHDRKMLDLLNDSIRIKSEDLEDEREDLSPREIREREREIANEKQMREALYNELEESADAAPEEAPAAPAEPASNESALLRPMMIIEPQEEE